MKIVIELWKFGELRTSVASASASLEYPMYKSLLTVDSVGLKFLQPCISPMQVTLTGEGRSTL